ncbi:bacteriophage abortive infection AbiH family protein [uncultured Clostridium sp.]|uniref:bacteriophage abortive infection AbiH family protein n=1 Tax=uncultured Clostridium sp. TaxID=59620 RepID=UPI0028ECA238|nr:bacteriophage abortive infection AbiH family protein [uncultured Clostridium sp.]
MNLFVIGNGFDRAHGLKTSYIDFRNYLEDKDWEYLTCLEKMYNFLPDSRREMVEEYLWKEFEKNLSAVNEDEIIDFGTSIDMGLEGGDIGIEDTLDDYWEEQYGYIEKLNEFIKLWIKQININTPKKTNRIKGNRNDLFLTFNYTLLLEKIYEIDKNNIIHIHGSIDEENDLAPVIGHGDSFKIIEVKRRANEAGEEFYEKECSIYNALAKYYKRTFKDVNHYIAIHTDFFRRLSDVDKIFVIGHSLGDVDIPYFKKIKENTKQDVVWNIYYHDHGDNINFMNKIVSIGVKMENIKMLKSKDFFK